MDTVMFKFYHVFIYAALFKFHITTTKAFFIAAQLNVVRIWGCSQFFG